MATTTSEDPLAEEITVPIVVQGARGTFERDGLIDVLAQAAAKHDASIQAFPPEAVYGRGHLAAAARRAVRAHDEGRAIARNLSVEIACYAAGTDQIEDAFSLVGVPEQGEALVLCAVGEHARALVDAAMEQASLDPDEDVIKEDEDTLDRIGIPARMREQVSEKHWPLLAIEHVALLDARR